AQPKPASQRIGSHACKDERGYNDQIGGKQRAESDCQRQRQHPVQWRERVKEEVGAVSVVYVVGEEGIRVEVQQRITHPPEIPHILPAVGGARQVIRDDGEQTTQQEKSDN